MRTFLRVIALGSAISGLALSAHAAQYIDNGSFETGDFTGWTTSNLNATLVASAGFDGWPAEGNFFAALGNVGSDGVLSQTFVDTPGSTLLISFYQGSDGGTPNDFSATFDGTPLLLLVNQTNQRPNYTHFTFTATATGSDTLSFNERNDPGYDALDNVTVTSMPEPAAWATMLLGIGLAGGALRRRTARAG
ncbi:MAG TPA: PEPxxWA-CTERM sorting domain-containing protein [Caulobacteraceae bacterium]|jgi:hypothetical protein